METRANYALIGAFTIMVIASAFAFIFWFSGGDKQALKTYRIIFNGSVSGLSRGSRVLFNGLPVGEVTQIDLMEEDPSRIAAIIAVSQRTPVMTDTRAKLEQQGLTGVEAIALIGGSASAKPLDGLKPGDTPIIFAERSVIENLLENVQNLATKSDTVLDNVNKLLIDNSDSIHNTVRNIERVTDALARNADGLDQIVVNAEQLTAKLNESAGKIDGVIADFKTLIGPGGVGNDAKNTLADISSAATSFRKLADNLDARTKEITSGISHITGPTAHEYEALASDARRSLNELNKTMQSISQNPQQFLLGAKPNIPEYTGK